ncbi:MAG: GNAT family N-acetyltransferase [Micromonosporaceae bacterium]
MEILRVDPSGEAALRSWYEAYHAGAVAGREAPSNSLGPQDLAVILRTWHGYRSEAYAAYAGGRVVGGALVMMPLLDNPQHMDFDVNVPPAERRRGVGTALFGHVLDVARAQGRTRLLSELIEPYQGKGPAEGKRFAERRGFRCVHREVHQILDLPLSAATAGALSHEVAERQRDYQLRTWSGPCPEELIDGYVALRARFIGEVPLGEMDYQPEHWDTERVRAEERRDAEQKRIVYTTVAIAPDGELVGHTVLKLPERGPDRVNQGHTMVLPGHRGQRLGLGLKLTNLRALLAAYPDCRVVHTWNANDNGPMVALNDRMGFRAVEQMGAYQRDL